LDETSWTVNSPVASVVDYFHQFLAIISIKGLELSYPATITFVQYGITESTTTSAIWSDWVDADSTLSIDSSVGNGKWSTKDTTSWTVNSSISATVNYQQATQPSPEGQEGGLPIAAIVGIAVGGCALIAAIYFAMKKWVLKK
jgi:hypothetical protein